MGRGFGDGWRDWQPPRTKDGPPTAHQPRPGGGPAVPPPRAAGPSRAAPNPHRKGRDRGSARGARRVIVTLDHPRQVVEHELAKNTGVKGEFFQSRREALRYLALLSMVDAGTVKNLRRQVAYPLMARNPQGLMEVVTRYIADFVYERIVGGDLERWESIVEDVKPSGGLREDAYLLKRKWFETQNGVRILETH